MDSTPSPAPVIGDRTKFSDSEKEYNNYIKHVPGEKVDFAAEVALKLDSIEIQPSSGFSYFEAGLGRPIVFREVVGKMIARARQLDNVRLRAVAKEFSPKHVIEALPEIADLLERYPLLNVTITNLPFGAATKIAFTKNKPEQERVWHKAELEVGDIKSQVLDLEGVIRKNWGLVTDENGDAKSEKQVVLNIYRKTAREMLGSTIPQEGGAVSSHNLVTASHPWNRGSDEKWKLLRTLMRSLAPGGMIHGTHVWGYDDAEKIISRACNGFEPRRDSARSMFTNALWNMKSVEREKFSLQSHLQYCSFIPPSGKTDKEVAEIALRVAEYSVQVPEEYRQAARRETCINQAGDVLFEKGGKLWICNENYSIKCALG